MRKTLKILYLQIMKVKLIRRLRYKDRSRDELLVYWQNPVDVLNKPSEYATRTMRSERFVKIVQEYMETPGHILEIGSNVGRNLHHLHLASFQVSGIEISNSAVEAMKSHYPDLIRSATIYNASVEEAIVNVPDKFFDMVFTMAVLEHIHPDSEWIFSEMVRVTSRWLITVEDEKMVSERHFPRNYRSIFQSLGMKQISEYDCTDWGFYSSGIKLRIFERIEQNT